MSEPITASDIFESIRVKVRLGELRPGDTLPPVREMAKVLDVNRNTVAYAYKKLIAAGIAVTNGRNGTSIRVLKGVPEQEGSSPETSLLDVAGGNPEVSMLPQIGTLLDAIRPEPRIYGEPVINSGLQAIGWEWFIDDVPAGFGLNLTHGAVDAIERLVMGYLASSEKIAVEDPCFLSSINTVRSMGFVPTGVDIDQFGMRPDALRSALKDGAQVVIITPRAHNPTGCSLTETRADDIRSVLSDYPHVMIVVDDHFSLVSDAVYHNVIPEGWRNWAVIRSLSKFLGPDLRMAFVAANPESSLRIEQRLAAGTNWVSHILQDIAEKALTSEEVKKQLVQARFFYRDQRERFLAALRVQGIDTGRSYDGLNIWLPLQNPPKTMLEFLNKKGWTARVGSVFSLNNSENGLRLSVSGLDNSRMELLAEALAEALDHCGNKIIPID